MKPIGITFYIVSASVLLFYVFKSGAPHFVLFWLGIIIEVFAGIFIPRIPQQLWIIRLASAVAALWLPVIISINIDSLKPIAPIGIGYLLTASLIGLNNAFKIS
jgi:hypothetical protein